MNIISILYITILFFILTPGILFTIPTSLNNSYEFTDKYIISSFHALLFCSIYYISHGILQRLNNYYEKHINLMMC